MKTRLLLLILYTIPIIKADPSISVPLENIIIPSGSQNINKCDFLRELTKKKPSTNGFYNDDSTANNTGFQRPAEDKNNFPMDLRCMIQEYLKNTFQPTGQGIFTGNFCNQMKTPSFNKAATFLKQYTNPMPQNINNSMLAPPIQPILQPQMQPMLPGGIPPNMQRPAQPPVVVVTTYVDRIITIDSSANNRIDSFPLNSAFPSPPILQENSSQPTGVPPICQPPTTQTNCLPTDQMLSASIRPQFPPQNIPISMPSIPLPSPNLQMPSFPRCNEYPQSDMLQQAVRPLQPNMNQPVNMLPQPQQMCQQPNIPQQPGMNQPINMLPSSQTQQMCQQPNMLQLPLQGQPFPQSLQSQQTCQQPMLNQRLNMPQSVPPQQFQRPNMPQQNCLSQPPIINQQSNMLQQNPQPQQLFQRPMLNQQINLPQQMCQQPNMNQQINIPQQMCQQPNMNQQINIPQQMCQQPNMNQQINMPRQIRQPQFMNQQLNMPMVNNMGQQFPQQQFSNQPGCNFSQQQCVNPPTVGMNQNFPQANNNGMNCLSPDNAYNSFPRRGTFDSLSNQNQGDWLMSKQLMCQMQDPNFYANQNMPGISKPKKRRKHKNKMKKRPIINQDDLCN